MLPLVSIPFLPEPIGNLLLLIGSFLLLLLGAEIFTNGIEWLGHRFGVSESATGSILAAVGTALPETMIPVIAILNAQFGGGSQAAADEVGVGAILGAPFMLATIAMFLIGVSVLYFRDRRLFDDEFHLHVVSTRRDLSFFLVGYSLAFVAALIPREASIVAEVRGVHLMQAIAAFLVILYIVYVYRSLKSGALIEGEGLDDLYLGAVIERGQSPLPAVGMPSPHSTDPPRLVVLGQTLIALGVIIAGAHLFVVEVSWAAGALGAPAAVVSLLLAPLATELPEKFNSILWISRDKDTLAIGNITGAMAFQGTLPVTLGILFTSWNLSFDPGGNPEGFLNGLSAVLAIVSGAILYLRARRSTGETLSPRPFLIGGAFYFLFILIFVYLLLTGSFTGVEVAGH